MKTKTNKLLAIGASAIAVALGVGVFASLGHDGLLLRSKATEIVNSSFVFECSSSTMQKLSNYKYSFRSTSVRGTNVYLVSENSYTLSTSKGLVASYGGSGYATKYLSFYSDAEGTLGFNFQKITSVSITTHTSSDNGATFSLINSEQGNVAYSGTIDKGSTVVVTTEIAKSKYLKLVPTSSRFLDIASITINYSCDPSGEPEEDPVLESLTLTGGKNHYNLNESFSFTGTATAHYDNTTSKIVTPVVSTAPDMTTIGIKTAVLSFTENDVTVYANFTVYVGVYGLSYKEYGQESGFAHGTLDSNAPTYAVPGSIVTFEVTPDSGYELVDCMDMGGEVEYTVDGNEVSFTMPYADLELLIVIQESEEPGGGGESSFADGDYQRAGGNYGGVYTIFGFYLNNDGTGYYYRNPKTSSDSSVAKCNITWSVSSDGKTITFTNNIYTSPTDPSKSQSMTDFGGKRPFPSSSVGSTNTGTISGNKFTIDLYTSTGSRSETCDFTLTA